MFYIILIFLFLLTLYFSLPFYFHYKVGKPQSCFSIDISNKEIYDINIYGKTKIIYDLMEHHDILYIIKFFRRFFIHNKIKKEKILSNLYVSIYFEDNNKESDHEHVFDFSTFKTKSIIKINTKYLIPGNDLQLIELIIHEYIHFYLKECYGTWDEDHNNNIWFEQNVLLKFKK